MDQFTFTCPHTGIECVLDKAPQTFVDEEAKKWNETEYAKESKLFLGERDLYLAKKKRIDEDLAVWRREYERPTLWRRLLYLFVMDWGFEDYLEEHDKDLYIKWKSNRMPKFDFYPKKTRYFLSPVSQDRIYFNDPNENEEWRKLRAESLEEIW